MAKNTLYFFTGVLLTFFLFSFSTYSVRNTNETLISKHFLQIIDEISTVVETYKEPVDISKTQEAIFKTFTQSYQDPYTAYISKEDSVMFNTTINGDFEGIGAYIEDSPNGGVFVQ
jgi:C-terminal processing protease CtpA/Prc